MVFMEAYPEMRSRFNIELILVSLICIGGCGFLVVQNPLHVPTANQGIWQDRETIMTGTSSDQYAVQEPTVIYEGSPVIFAGQKNVFKMWHTCGWLTGNVCYAESTDGFNFTRLNGGQPIIQGVGRPFVLHIGNTYYLYATQEVNGAGWNRYESSDGINWQLTNSLVLKVGGPSWENGPSSGNIFVWTEDSTWYALYEAYGSDWHWRIGLATSPDGIAWTKDASNPVISFPYCGGPEIHKISGTYYMWAQCNQTGTSATDIYRFSSTDLHAWTLEVIAFTRKTYDEGVDDNVNAQVADPSMVEVNGATYMYYDATRTQNPTAANGMHLKVTVANMSISSLATSN
jgi:hypothetical protein